MLIYQQHECTSSSSAEIMVFVGAISACLLYSPGRGNGSRFTVSLHMFLNFLLIGIVSAQTSRTCLFWVGPKQGTAESFPRAQPILLGTACNDGIASRGYAISDSRAIGQFSMIGQNPNCSEITHVMVPYRPNENIPKTGLATFVGNQPIIYIKTSQIPTFSRPVRDYLYAHECGHHALGQVRGYLI